MTRFFFGATAALCMALVLFVMTGLWIGYSVIAQCDSLKSRTEGDCIQALIQVVNDSTANYRSRNKAIWALGQLGDPKALPYLTTYYTGNIPSRESLDTTISQHELKKAIALVRGGPNITAFLWRGLLQRQ